MTISKASYLLSLFHVCHPDFHSGHSTQIELTKIINQILKLHCWESFNGFLFSSVAQLSPTLCDPMYFGTPGFPVHDQLLELAHSCPLSRWCHPTLSSSVIPLSSCLQSSPASGSFPTSQLFASGGQSIGSSASASVLPMNIQDWFPVGLTGLISLQSKGLKSLLWHHSSVALR